MARLTLAIGLVLIALWTVFTFVLPTGLGVVHLLLAAGVLLVMRWWVIREA